MADQPFALTLLGTLVVVAPVALLTVLGLAGLFERKLTERATALAVFLTTSVSLFASVGVFVLMLAWDTRHVVIQMGDWAHVGGDGPHYHFSVKFVFDRLSVPFVALTLVLCGTISAFADRYMHRERGYNRFFFFFALFLAGMVVASLAGTIETLFAGWELVGLSSALLVGFFHERPAPVRNGLRVWAVYRVSDAALLLAAVVLHHSSGGGDLDRLTGYREIPGVSSLELPSWPFGRCTLPTGQALLVGLLLLLAAAGKSALVPFSGWLPRAMEGPTPSSAVFYGALSVHLGAFLLLRVSPLLEASLPLAIAVVVLGLTTALFASLTGSVQTDIKSALSFASLTQVGLIVAEIGLGLRYVALVHLLGHACLRTLQFLRAPTLLQDYRQLENAIGARLPRPGISWIKLVPESARLWFYRFALERGYLDAALDRYLVGPFVRLFRWCDDLEQRATSSLVREAVEPASNEVEAVREVEHAR